MQIEGRDVSSNNFAEKKRVELGWASPPPILCSIFRATFNYKITPRL
uniref:Uncharacterized protein n=1 Tax=Arundo donax TaxID=35708 RepID=A0A0A8Z302_ARUDO